MTFQGLKDWEEDSLTFVRETYQKVGGTQPSEDDMRWAARKIAEAMRRLDRYRPEPSEESKGGE